MTSTGNPKPQTPADWREVVGLALEAGRKANGIGSMREAARRAHISEATWRQLESGRRQLAPDHVVAPSPKADTLIAAAIVAGLNAAALLEAAGYSVEDVERAERYEASYWEGDARARRNAIAHDALAQTMVRNSEGIVGFRTGPPLDEGDAPAPAELVDQWLRGIWAQLSLKGRQEVVSYAMAVQQSEVHEWEMLVAENEEFAQAARAGSEDPHDDQVGEITVGHPGGSAPEDGDA